MAWRKRLRLRRGAVGTACAVLCCLALTAFTLAPPTIPGDWARLDANGVFSLPRLDYPWPSYAVQVGLWVGMVMGLSVGREKRNAEKQRNRAPEGRALAALVVVTLLGFALRLRTLDDLPLIIDEIGFAAHASYMLHGQHVPVFAPGHNGNPSVYSWLLSGALALWGQTPFAIRLLPLAFGTLTVPAVYFLGRTGWSRRVGLLAAVFLATYPAHVHFSRLSLYNSVDPFFAALALAFLMRAVKQGRPLDWLSAGITAAVAQYFYHGSRLLLLLMAAYLLIRQKHNAEQQRNRAAEEQLFPLCFSEPLNLCVTLFLLTLPRFAPLLAAGLPLTGNLQAPRLPADFAANVQRSLLAWTGQPDMSPFWLSDAPLLEWPSLAAFAVGVLVCLRRWRDGRSAVLLLAVVLTTVFGGMIWPAAPLYVRYLTAAPEIALLVGVGLAAISGQRSANTGRFRLAALMALLIVTQNLFAAWNHPAEAYSRITPSQWQEAALAQAAVSLPPGEAAMLTASPGLDPVQRITLAHYVAALGEPRTVILSNFP